MKFNTRFAICTAALFLVLESLPWPTHGKKMGRKSISRKASPHSSRASRRSGRASRQSSNGEPSPRHTSSRQKVPSRHSNNARSNPRLHSHNTHSRPSVGSSHRRVRRIARSRVTLDGTRDRCSRHAVGLETEAIPSMAV